MNNNDRTLLGEILIEYGLINTEQLQEALDIQANTREKLGSILLSLGYVSEPDLMAVLEYQTGIPYVNLARTPIEPEIAQLIPQSLAMRHKVIPFGKRSTKLIVAMADPKNVLAIDDVRIATGMEITPVLAAESDLITVIKRYLGVKESLDKMIGDLDPVVEVPKEEVQEEKADVSELSEAGPIVQFVNSIIDQAVANRASDVHVEPQEKEVVVRYRVDGMLHRAMSSPKKTQASLVSCLKIMANMDIAEKRVPQDGRIAMKVQGRDIDLRVNSLPTVHGEKIAIRILDKSTSLRPIDALGMQPRTLRTFRELIKQPYGMLLITGPTGSGKTTALYSVLQELNREETNLISIEDPVEYTLAGINQVNVNTKAGLTFASGLRAILRQDPDVVMVGEIRDNETVSIAVGAALTGHLVLSTLHTNSAAAAITRLMDMGVEPYMISASITGVMAQHLVRKICPHCKQTYDVSTNLVKQLMLDKHTTFYRGKGCSRCNNTGYKGRVAIQELLVFDQEIKELILSGASAAEIERAAIKSGMHSLKMDGVAKAKEGLTTLDEVMTVISLD